jgi:hypothetical protein
MVQMDRNVQQRIYRHFNCNILGCIKTRNRLVKTQQNLFSVYVLTVHKEHLQRKTTTCFGQL